MKEERYFYVPDAGKADVLPEEEAQHAVKVLRLKEGSQIYLMDGVGCYYLAEIVLASNHKCQYRILETLPQERQWKRHLTVAMSPTKMMERTEWFVEKAVEIGVDEIVLLNCQMSERRQIKLPRLEKIVISAVKQSRKAWVPRISGMIDFDDFMKESRDGCKCIAHCFEGEKMHLLDAVRQNTSGDVTVLIGPEGDFSMPEIKLAEEKGYMPVTLGNSRLRTETAAVVAAEILQLGCNNI